MIYKLILFLFIFSNISFLVVLAKNLNISTDPADIKAASVDFGSISHVESLSVMYPNSAADIVQLVKKAYHSSKGYTVSARGNGQSMYGQAQAGDGVVIDMTDSKVASFQRKKPVQGPQGYYVDVWGGDLWVDVLNWTTTYGLAPRSWTIYLYVTVGGTLSTAGMGGQTYAYGPQISNVYELDVVTGKGELKTCSKRKNSDLFHAVLGGLGQFGIITRARIALEPAPESVFLINLYYKDFSVFVKDQEYLVSLHEKPSSERFDEVMGYATIGQGGVREYQIRVAKYFNKSTVEPVIQKIDSLLETLDFNRSSKTQTNISYYGYLDLVHARELVIKPQGLWDLPHPALTVLVPKSRFADFDKGVLNGLVGNNTGSIITTYPLNKNKWNSFTSAVTPDEEIFFAVWFSWTAQDKGKGLQASIDSFMNQNNKILEFCKNAGIKVKEYLPHYKNTQEEWIDHYGDKWELFRQNKKKFDPKHILATGQKIFSFESL